MKGAASPAKSLVFLSAMPPSTIMAMPVRSIAAAIHQYSLKKTAENMAMMTVLAPQGMKVAKITVILWSRTFSIVRAAITAGTPQPLPTSIGINDLPESPKLLKSLSMMKATLAMYPQSSRKARNKKTSAMMGTKPSTVQTPPITPSLMSA